MNPDKDTKNPQQNDQPRGEEEKQHPSPFKETYHGDEKSTTNIEEEAALEQQRKEALTERD